MCAGAVSSWHHRRRACCCHSPGALRASAAAATPPPASLCRCAAPESYCCSGRTPTMTSSCRSTRSSGPTCMLHLWCTCSTRCVFERLCVSKIKTSVLFSSIMDQTPFPAPVWLLLLCRSKCFKTDLFIG